MIISKRGRTNNSPKDESTSTLDLVRAAHDVQFFMNTFIMKMNPEQIRFLGSVQEFKGVVCNQPRAIGITTASMVYLLWDAIFHNHKTIVALLPRYVMAQDCHRIIMNMWEKLPLFLRCGIKFRNRNTIEFENGSRIHFGAVTESSCRGLSVSTLYLGDLGLADPVHAELMWSIVAPCLGVNSKVICHSMQTDEFNLFADMYRAAVSGHNHWTALDLS